MCMMCDGASLDEVLAVYDDEVATCGYAVVPVIGSERRPDACWAYTIGLLERFDHPELVIAQTELDTAIIELDAMVELIEAGARLHLADALEVVESRSGRARRFDLVDVHQVHLERGLMAMWMAYYSRPGMTVPPPLRARQVYSDDLRCEHHAGRHLLLDSNVDVLDLARPNRAERRARERSEGRRHRRGPHR